MDYKMQIDGTVDEVAGIDKFQTKWETFGWTAVTVDGHSVEGPDAAIQFAKSLQSQKKLVMIIMMNTIKGKGLSYAEQLGCGSHNYAIDESLNEFILEEYQ